MRQANRIDLAPCGAGRGGATRREFLGLTMLAAAGAAIGVAGAPAGARAALTWGRQPAQEGLGWEELREGVWAALGGGGNSMVAISGEDSGEALLVDTKIATFGPSLARQTRARAPELALVINTHHHADHSGGNFAFEGPRLLAHAKAEPRIRGQMERYVAQLRAALTGSGLPEAVREDLQSVRERLDELDAGSWTPRETMAGASAEWALGELKIEGRHFGAGHTDNDLVIRLPERNVVHAGDLLFHAMHPYFDPSGGATCKGWIESVRRTIELCDGETVVIPGHGEVTDVEGLKRQMSYLEKLWEEVGALVAAGVSREEATGRQWPFMEGLGQPERRARAIGAVFDERMAEGG